MQLDETFSVALTYVGITVDGDRSSRGFHLAHLRPESRVSGRILQFLVSIVWNNRQYRLNSKLGYDRPHPFPTTPFQRGAQIVKANKILRRLWNHPWLLRSKTLR